jgi:hypothetical protein
MKSLFNRSTTALACALLLGLARPGVAQGPRAPGMPAAPLAGGNAAVGGAYMDVHGNPIVLPASYMQGCEPYGAYGGMCPEGCGYGPGYECGQEGYADFGGSSYPDQVGPHYFDVAVEGVALMGEDLFQDVPALGSIGVAGPLILTPEELNDNYDVGWQIHVRYDLGPLSIIEGTYMGVYDLDIDETVRSVDVAPGGLDFQLASVFSQYGIDPIDGLDEASVYNLNYQSDLQSTELSYRRYWVGWNPRVSGTYLAGFRYIRLTEDLNFNSVALGGNSNLFWRDSNDLVGAQIGGDMWIGLRQGLRLGIDSKAGIYNNRWEYSHITAIPDPDITNANFDAAGDQVAFAGETRVDLVADILPSFSIRGGYRALYLNSLVTVGNNIDPTNVTSTAVFTQADAIYHGFHAGLEYIW